MARIAQPFRTVYRLGRLLPVFTNDDAYLGTVYLF
jgi:hypothetical protein